MSYSTNRSVLLKNPKCVSNTGYNRLIQLRSMKSRDGNIDDVARSTGQNVVIPDNKTYEDLKMRRKVEILQYKNLHGQTTKKHSFGRLSKVKGSSELSQSTIQNAIPCAQESILLPPTYSGIHDQGYPGYQLNPLIRFRSFL